MPVGPGVRNAEVDVAGCLALSVGTDRTEGVGLVEGLTDTTVGFGFGCGGDASCGDPIVSAVAAPATTRRSESRSRSVDARVASRLGFSGTFISVHVLRVDGDGPETAGLSWNHELAAV